MHRPLKPLLSREEKVDFSNMTFVDGGSYISKARSKIATLKDLEGKKISVIPGTTTEKVLKATLDRAQIGGGRLAHGRQLCRGLVVSSTGQTHTPIRTSTGPNRNAPQSGPRGVSSTTADAQTPLAAPRHSDREQQEGK